MRKMSLYRKTTAILIVVLFLIMGSGYAYLENVLSIGGTMNIEKIAIMFTTNTYSIYNINEGIPVVISNNNSYDISGNISYNGIVLVDNFTVKAHTDYQIISVKLTEEIYNNLTDGEVNYLLINMTEPYQTEYKDKVSFKKEKSIVDIISVESSLENDKVTYTENTVAIDNELDSVNSEVTYTIKLKNNHNNANYKFRNITEIINSNENSSYQASINLADGIFVKRLDEFTFTLTYKYDSTLKDNSHRQILQFDFKEEIIFGGVSDRMISLSMPAISTETKYGDFISYKDRYSDSDILKYDADGGLILSQNNSILKLDIDQSMSVDDEYSVYFTVKGDTNQTGVPDSFFGCTILAISQENTKYLCWVTFYKNFLNVSSYYNGNAASIYSEYEKEGFASFDISEYSNKKVNIQITAVRGGYTKVYINGILKKTFSSGPNPVDYIFASIGDLRSNRGLKFTGVIYDVVFYNKALSEEEVQTNWNYAKSTWGIE